MEEIAAGEAVGLASFDSFAWPLCADFRDLGTCFLAPRIPPSILVPAFTIFLDLADDEVLLAVFCERTGRGMTAHCALTTKRVYWAGDERRDPATPADPDRPSAAGEGAPPLRCDYLAYQDLPETIALAGVTKKVVNLGEGRTIDVGSQVRPLKALVAFLTAVRARVRGESMVVEISPVVQEQFKRAWPAVVACDAKARSLQAELRRYRARTTAARYPVVSVLLAAACVGVFALMVARGVSPIEPQGEQLWRWGASSGISVVFESEAWRLASSMFLHIGFVHLAMNMWGLLSIGPLVERFFGHVSFAAIYLLSGIAGSVASMALQPLVNLAGASGAIFGLLGALLAFLLVRAGDVPLVVLRPMRAGTLALVGYSVIFGLMIPKISMAAHIGGLVAGFVVGLLLALGKAGTLQQKLWRAGAIVGLSVAAFLGTGRAIAYTRAQLLADPMVGPQILNQIKYLPEWVAYERAAQPALEEFDRIERERTGLQKQLNRQPIAGPENLRVLENLIRDSDALGRQLAVLPTDNDEIRAINGKLLEARSDLNKALVLLRRYLQTGDGSLIGGPDGFNANIEAEDKNLEAFVAARAAYEKNHGIVRSPR